MRIADVCTHYEDGITVAAVFLCVLHMLYRLKRNNQRWRRYNNMLVQENRWRAQRYGYDEGLVDFGKGEVVPYADLFEELLALTKEDAKRFDCVAEIRHGRKILKRGTSAHRQLAVYYKAIEAGAEPQEALKKVVDFLIKETVAGLVRASGPLDISGVRANIEGRGANSEGYSSESWTTRPARNWRQRPFAAWSSTCASTPRCRTSTS